MVTCEEACWVRLLVKETGELFAECPVPPGQPLVTVRGTGRGTRGQRSGLWARRAAR